MSRWHRVPAAATRGLAAALTGLTLLLVGWCVAAAFVVEGAPSGADVIRGVASGVGFGVLGGLVAGRRPQLPLGWLMLAAGLSGAFSSACDAFAWWALGNGHRALAETAYWVAGWSWAPGYLLPVTLVLLLFPTGRPPSPRWRPVVALSWAVVVMATAGWALTPYDEQDFAPPPAFADAEPVLAVPGAGILLTVVLPLFLVCAVASVASVVVRWRRAEPGSHERDQLSWLVLAAAVLAGLLAIALVTPGAGPGLIAVAMLAVPIALAVAILRRGLWQLDLVLDRSLVYGGLTLAVVLVYAALVWMAGSLTGVVGPDLRIAAVVVAAVATAPLRDRLQLGVNRLLYGDRDDPEAAMARLADRLDAATHPADVLPAVAQGVVRTLRVPWAEVETARGARGAAGTPTGLAVDVPLHYQGREVGTMRVAPRAGESGLGTRELAVLERLARQAALAAHAAALSEDLVRSRERLVLSREEERRRLRRDLHDDLGPTLAATAMKLESTRDLVARDPDAAVAALDVAAERLRASVAGVRRIVDDLRPPSLDGLGLAGALREQLDQFGDSIDLCLDVRVPEELLRSLPAAVDVAAYRITSEAVTNAVRHARPTRVDVVLEVVDHELALTVTDDGSGMSADARAGVGLESVHHRAAEVGGTCAIHSRPGAGTVLAARLPLETP
jgi:signal transduction histidine kinase